MAGNFYLLQQNKSVLNIERNRSNVKVTGSHCSPGVERLDLRLHVRVQSRFPLLRVALLVGRVGLPELGEQFLLLLSEQEQVLAHLVLALVGHARHNLDCDQTIAIQLRRSPLVYPQNVIFFLFVG